VVVLDLHRALKIFYRTVMDLERFWREKNRKNVISPFNWDKIHPHVVKCINCNLLYKLKWEVEQKNVEIFEVRRAAALLTIVRSIYPISHSNTYFLCISRLETGSKCDFPSKLDPTFMAPDPPFRTIRSKS
jgi:hypothetical protein